MVLPHPPLPPLKWQVWGSGVTWNMIEQELISGITKGILFGSVLGAVSVGLTLIWGVMKVVNLAHGHFVILAAMLVAFLYNTRHAALYTDPIVAVVVMGALGLVLGAVFYYAVLHPIIGHVDTMTLKYEMSSLMAAFGAGTAIYGFHYFLTNVVHVEGYNTNIGILYGIGKPPYVNVGGVILQKSMIVMAVESFLLVIVAFMVMNLTGFGLKIRAVAQDARALSLVGINPVRVKLYTTILSTSLAMAAGALYLGYVMQVNPGSESIVAPLAFVIVVVGGLGSVMGTYLGGVLLGLVYQLTYELTGQNDKIALAVAFSILVIALLVRPQGVFGRADEWFNRVFRRGGEYEERR